MPEPYFIFGYSEQPQNHRGLSSIFVGKLLRWDNVDKINLES